MLQLVKGLPYERIYSASPKSANYVTTTNAPNGLGQQVSTTRGAPSTSVDLKEALCEKIPLHHDLLRKFRRQHGSAVVSRITVDDLYRGLNGVDAVVRETSEVDPKRGVKYRGLTVPEVITLLPRRGNAPCPEAVFWLLLTGDVPTREQTASLVADWGVRRRERKRWWAEEDGGAVGSVLRALPENVSPLGRFCVALTALGTDERMKEAVENGATSHTHWEYAYEDGMELLATLPAVVGLVNGARDIRSTAEGGDWVDFLLECLGSVSSLGEDRRASLGDFLRLYITVNADEDGGVPGAHVTQILGDSQPRTSYALAAGALAYANEPRSGTMFQCMNFQMKLQNALGREPKEAAIKDFVRFLIEKVDGVTGYRESEFCDPRYGALRDYARDHLPENAEVELSRTISRVLIPMMKTAKGKDIWPEQNTLAVPIFRLFGLKDMEFNQVLLCMSRALGAIASTIWTKAINAPGERPRSNCTHTYFESVRDVRKRRSPSTVKYLRYPK